MVLMTINQGVATQFDFKPKQTKKWWKNFNFIRNDKEMEQPKLLKKIYKR